MNDILLDSTDLDILRALQENARLTTKELAARVNLSTTPVFERLKRLVSLGGFIPCPDHRLMPGTKFELVQYYAEEIKKIRI